MKFKYNDGGRSKYFKADNVGDCVTRAIAIALNKDYKEVYDELNKMAKKESTKRHRGHKRSQSRNGVFKETWKRYLAKAGWVHVSTCAIGSTKGKLRFVDGALPEQGTYIVQLSRHLTTLVDGVINDTYDCSKKKYYDWETGDLVTNDERCVYGYWRAPTPEEQDLHNDCVARQQEYKEFCENQKKELAKKKEEVKKHNTKITKKYASRINKLKAQLRKLERERDSQLLPTPTLEKDAWAKYCISKEWDENGEYDREGM